MVQQIISPPIKLFTLAKIFICKQRNNKILTWYERRHDTFCANRPLTGVTITFIRCLYRVTGVSIGQGDIIDNRKYIPITPPHLTLCLTLISSNYRCLEHISMVPKVFEPSKIYCNYFRCAKFYIFLC